MEKIFYSSRNIKKLDIIGRGSTAIVYHDPFYGKALKIYINDSSLLLRRALRFKNNDELKHCNVIVPEKEVYVDDKLKGYSMDYVDGYTFKELLILNIENIDINDFNNAYNRAYDDITKISKLGIDFGFDITNENIMYDCINKRICFIDIDYYDKTNKKYEGILNHNMWAFEASGSVKMMIKKLSENNKRL